MKMKFLNEKSLTNNKIRNAAKIIIILALFLSSYTIFHINIAPKIYLSKKYDTVYSSVQIKKYYPSKLISDFSFKNIFDIDSSPSSNYFCTEKWDCIINNREFKIEYYMFHFVDDYQLEDIFDWGTEFLQEHVDKNIVGLDTGDGIIYKSPDLYKGSLTSTIKNNSKKRNLWTKDNIDDLFSTIYQEEKCLTIYYMVDDFREYGESFDDQEYLGNNKYDELYDTIIKNIDDVLGIQEVNLIVIDEYTEISRNAKNPYDKYYYQTISIEFNEYVRGRWYDK